MSLSISGARILSGLFRAQVKSRTLFTCRVCQPIPIHNPRFERSVPWILQYKHHNVPACSFSLSNAHRKGKSKKGKKQEVIIRQEDAAEFIDLTSVNEKMQETVATLTEDYTRNFRVGADAKLLDQITFVLEGDEYQLREVARIVKKSARLLELDFVDFPEALKASEAAIHDSALNFNPSIKGTKIEVPIPEVTTEHRKILVKAAKKRMNDAKEELRRVRNSSEKTLSKLEKVPKDILMAIRKQTQVYLDQHSKEVEDAFKSKEKELTLH